MRLFNIILKAAVVAFGMLLFMQSHAYSQKGESPPGMPKWLAEHFTFMTKESGRWITDNSKFKSADEPFEEYATEWSFGVGRKSLKGRLFALNGKKEIGEFWEYRVFWHPQEKRAVFEQFGAGGVYGIGEMRLIESEKGNTEIVVEMIFHALDGSRWNDLHRLTENVDEHTTRSYLLKDSSWKLGRTYVWKRAKP